MYNHNEYGKDPIYFLSFKSNSFKTRQ